MRKFRAPDEDFIKASELFSQINLLFNALTDKNSPYVPSYKPNDGFPHNLKDFNRALHFYHEKINPRFSRLGIIQIFSPIEYIYFRHMKDIEPTLKKIADDREKLREKLSKYFKLISPYAPKEMQKNFLEDIKFPDLSLTSTLKSTFAPYLSPCFLKIFFEQTVYPNINLANPYVLTMILKNGLWELLDMPSKIFDKMTTSCALLQAVKDGEIVHVEKLIAQGARSCKAIDGEKQTPLHLAMKHKAELLKILLKHDDTLDFEIRNAKNMTPLEFGYDCNNSETIKILETHLRDRLNGGDSLSQEEETPVNDEINDLQKLKSEKKQKILEGLSAELNKWNNYLKNEISSSLCFAESKEKLKLEFDLVSKMISLLQDSEKSSDDYKHGVLSSLLEEEKYKAIISNPSPIRDLARSTLIFFDNEFSSDLETAILLNFSHSKASFFRCDSGRQSKAVARDLSGLSIK